MGCHIRCKLETDNPRGRHKFLRMLAFCLDGSLSILLGIGNKLNKMRCKAGKKRKLRYHSNPAGMNKLTDQRYLGFSYHRSSRKMQRHKSDRNRDMTHTPPFHHHKTHPCIHKHSHQPHLQPYTSPHYRRDTQSH